MALSLKQRGYEPLLNTPTTLFAHGGTANAPTVTIDATVQAFQVDLPVPTTGNTEQVLTITIDTTNGPNPWNNGSPRIALHHYLLDSATVPQNVQLELRNDATPPTNNQMRVRRTSVDGTTNIDGRMVIIMECIPRTN